ncbi:hypothetical protein [Algoriphagus antarcticus]|uniref:YD repeat-containing protein n=1 Tax=Algoriphagus antarcticus TaxID=238540 RepID=A0A3E0DJI3_9BACT|nr:hypothetical protein [Algoriphagus antarcticus]REG82257.1 hypothetical protein C8N25_1222 [Algoriphagus antarcticus]
MRNCSLILVIAIIFWGCEIAQENESLPNDLELELEKLLSKPNDEPVGELFLVRTYGGDFDKIHSTREIVYPSGGDLSIHIIKDQNEDTVGIGLNHFKNGIIQISHYFDFSNQQPIWQSTQQYIYDSKGLLTEHFIETTSQSRKLLANYVYDSLNRLERIEYPNENDTELQVYTYDENNRIRSEWKSALGQDDAKIDFLIYEYTGDKLTAKKSGERGSLEGDFQDAIRYYYDQSGKLSIQDEFDPYFGFQQVNRSEFYYYKDGDGQ